MARQVCEFALTEQDDQLLQQLKGKARESPLSSQIASVYPKEGEDIFYNESRLVRFLFARDKNVEKSLAMWSDWAKWYIDMRPESIQQELIQEEIDAKKAFWFKQDNKNNPCLIVLIKNHIPLQEKIEQAKKFFIWMMEQGVKQAEINGTYRVTIIWDGKGFQRSQLNTAFLDFIKLVAKSLQDYYPNRLAAVYVTDPDFLFRLGYTILKPFLSTVITSKIHQIPMKDLHKYFTADCILPEHGGDANQISPLSPNYVQERQTASSALNQYKNQNMNQLGNNILHVDPHSHLHNNQHHHQNNIMSSSHMTDEFHSIANDSKIFYDNYSHSHFKLHNHDQQNQQNEQIIIEGNTTQNQSHCCSTQCAIF